MSETHLFIVWSNGEAVCNRIIEDISKHFVLIRTIQVVWERKEFANNLRRFYGKNLPKNSKKENEVGIGPFTVLIVEDEEPLYALRRTNQGVKDVNVNMFDSKEIYRTWARSNVIHATNDAHEFRHDFTLLFGSTPSERVYGLLASPWEKDLVAAKAWDSIEQLFEVLNNTQRYVVLRNFDGYPENIVFGSHSDIDILCDNFDSMALILNSRITDRNKGRVQNQVYVKDKMIMCDVRSVGDGYFDQNWQKDILDGRVLENELFYIPNKNDLLYTLMYHALIQKRKVSVDYYEKVKELSKVLCGEQIDLFNEDNALKTLGQYMKKKSYDYATPVDPTVGFNFRKINRKVCLKRWLHEVKHEIVLNAKRQRGE